MTGRTPNPRPMGDPSARNPGAVAAILHFFGALLWGKYDEDRTARRRAGVAGGLTLASAMLTIIGIRWAAESNRTDRLIAALEAQRADSQAQSKEVTGALIRSAVANERSADALRVTNGFLAVVIEEKTAPAAQQARRRYEPKPEGRRP